MTKRQRSPLRVKCSPWPFELEPGERRRSICHWVCDAPVAAEFTRRHSKYGPHTAILHPSTKGRGRWQVSFFDDLGAVSDVNRATCSEALKDADIVPSNWKLKAFERLRGV